MNGLMIAFAFSLPYHVLRTARAAGVRVHVLGSGPSRGLRASRHCASYQRSMVSGAGENDAELLLAEIHRVVARRRIDVIFPSDDVSTRLLAGLRDRLPVRSTPLPDLAAFDLLNDKWNFTRFARDHDIRVPQGWLYETPDDIGRDLRAGRLSLPLTLKPLNRSGGQGVVHVTSKAELDQIDAADYHPVLAQRHIIGETIGISVMCRDGRIVAHATQRRDDRRFQLFANPDLTAQVEKLVAATNLNGPANLDAVLEAETGLSYIVECNPRYWFTIYMSMIVGINFMEFALRDTPAASPERATLADREIRLSLKAALLHPWRASRSDRRFLGYHLGDPLAYMMERAKAFDDREIAVPIERMTAYDRPANTRALVA
jgi:biotin carboxylase